MPRNLAFSYLILTVKMRRYYCNEGKKAPDVLELSTLASGLIEGRCLSSLAQTDMTFPTKEMEEVKDSTKTLLEVSSWLLLWLAAMQTCEFDQARGHCCDALTQNRGKLGFRIPIQDNCSHLVLLLLSSYMYGTPGSPSAFFLQLRVLNNRNTANLMNRFLPCTDKLLLFSSPTTNRVPERFYPLAEKEKVKSSLTVEREVLCFPSEADTIS